MNDMQKRIQKEDERKARHELRRHEKEANRAARGGRPSSSGLVFAALGMLLVAVLLVGLSYGQTAFGAQDEPSPAPTSIPFANAAIIINPAPLITPSPTLTPTRAPTPSPVVTPMPTATPEPTPIVPEYLIGEGPRFTSVTQPDKVCYLTFDDGPSKLTPQLLDILDVYGVKATFFVIGDCINRYPDALRDIAARGHAIGNHTQTHKTGVIYLNAENLLKDAMDCDATIDAALGYTHPYPLFRFPYGSTNKLCRPYVDMIREMGYMSYDWNVVNGDAEVGKEKDIETLANRFLSTMKNAETKKEVVVLMHDTNTRQTTLDMLPAAIEYVLQQGYRFDTLDKKLAPLPSPWPTPNLSVIPTPTPEPTPVPETEIELPAPKPEVGG